jgi:hypothetical protein
VRLRPIVLLAPLALAATLAAAKERPPALPFIENDFDKAVAAAKTAARPVFVEVWAPW